ncbi:MAG TPA: protein kinase, partial [Vicinamibacterales bacterium]|nr:protein kinase [Vicinamibacterales bacterium]
MADTQVETNRCPQCGRTFPSTVKLCPNDGTVLDEQTPAGSKNLGTVLDGKYRLDSYLSKGGMGSVYKATHVMLNKAVAVKMINAEIVSSPEIVRRFQREARAATTLNHPNIAAVYDLGQTGDGTLYIAMEFIDGPSLKSVLSKEGPMDPARIVSLMWQVSAALAVAHRHSIIHRDLKPHNIMLTHDDHGREIAKLVDFGIAKTFDESTQLTQTGFVVGTPQYMAPEQAEGRPVDGRSDIYSLGVILYEMLSGDVPFSDPSTPMILIKHIKETPVLPSVKNPNAHVSPELEGIAMRCLQKDPAARFQTAEEFGSALNAVPLTPGGEAIKKDPAAARAWDFRTIVSSGSQTTAPQGASSAPTVPMSGPGATAPTVAAARTAATIPLAAPQQKTAIGQTAPPLPTVAATSATPGPASAPTVPTPMPGAGATMSAPPVVAPPRPTIAQPAAAPTPTVALPAPSTTSSKGPLMMAAAIILVLIAAGAYLKFGRSSAPAGPTPDATTASTAPASASAAPPAATSAPPPAPTDPGAGAPAAPPASASGPANPPASNPPSSSAPSSPAAPAPSAASAGRPSTPAVTRAATNGRAVPPAPVEPARTAPPATQPPAQPAAPAAAAFPANPAVAFRCSGAGDV